MVRDFHKIIGEEAQEQVLELTGRLPDAVTACVGGGSNAMGIFQAFLDDPDVALYGYEAAGEGHLTERHAATITRDRKSTRLNSSHANISYAVFCLNKK